MDVLERMLTDVKRYVDEGLDTKNMLKVMELIGFPGYDAELIESYRLWGDYLPRGEELPYTTEQRYLHILWEIVDRSPIGINCAFAIPFRQIIAKKLFKKCGEGFLANEGCRFNYGHLIEVGTNVTWNHCCYFDAKGGIKFCDSSMITEYTKIFTHGHSESDHVERAYKGVEIGEYAKVYTNCTVLPGVHIGKGAICATGAVVTKDVEDFTLVAGIPAKPIRKRKFEGDDLALLRHYTLSNNAFQVDLEKKQ